MPGTDEARRRSAELTAGSRWQIFWAGRTFETGFLLIAYLIYIRVDFFPESWPSLGTAAIGVALDCVLDVTNAIINIVMFLYYWQGVHRDPAVRDAGARYGCPPRSGWVLEVRWLRYGLSIIDIVFIYMTKRLKRRLYNCSSVCREGYRRDESNSMIKLTGYRKLGQ